MFSYGKLEVPLLTSCVQSALMRSVLQNCNQNVPCCSNSVLKTTISPCMSYDHLQLPLLLIAVHSESLVEVKANTKKKEGSEKETIKERALQSSEQKRVQYIAFNLWYPANIKAAPK